MKLPLYPSYKPSGVEWLGDVPKHWSVTRLKMAATYRVSSVDKVPADDELPVRLCNYTDVYYNERLTPDMPLMETTASEDEIKRFRLEKGDVLITKDSEDWADIAIPALVEESSDDLVCGYHLAIVRPISGFLSGPFLLRVFQASAVNQQFQLASSGVTRFGLPKSAIGDALLTLPPLDEQRAIAAFLDAETAKLDALIEKKRALIELLKEKRAALISRTVTRGLPPDAARAAGLDPEPTLKDSGIEWLGEVPAHWSLPPISKIATSIQTGPFGSQLHESDYVEGGIPLINPSHLLGGRITPADEDSIDEETAQRLARHRLLEGDIVFARRGEIGRCAVVGANEAGWLCGTGSMVVRLQRGTADYYGYVFRSAGFASLLTLNAVGTTMLNLNPSIVGRMLVPEPAAPEQIEIVRYLDKQTSEIDHMAAKVESAIERLREYRSALITAAVTGKIDVRQAVA